VQIISKGILRMPRYPSAH